ncbi:MAG: radical SAM protein [Clostridiales bacterium]|nr:radical SAM protein [Clostridiales bacterium]
MVNKRFPLKGTFELTGRCNLQCNMCYVRVNEQAIKKSGKKERTASEWIQMAEQIADAGTLSLLLTGGEVTLRSDFCEIYEAIAKMGFITTVYTNATNITDKVMSVFEKYPPQVIGVTMYGASPDTYQKICGSAEGYYRFLTGLSRLKELPSILETRTTLVKGNVSDYQAMKTFVEREFGPKQVLHVSAHVYKAVRNGICSPEKERLDAVENCSFFYSWLNNLKDLIENKKVPINKLIDIQKLQTTEQELKRRTLGGDGGYLFQNCGAGIDEFFISWAGDMYACGMLPVGCTHPFETGFRDAWENLPAQYPKTKINNRCRNCSLMPFCESCPAYRMVETGEWDGIPSYACEKAAYLKELLEPLFEETRNFS